MIKAELIQSTENFGHKFKTFKVTFPRYILAELNTHKMLSKNSASSRAIPFNKMVESVENNPFIPMAWQKDHKGMQGSEYLNENDSKKAQMIWLHQRDKAIQSAKALNSGIFEYHLEDKPVYDYKINVTKQLCNRLLEPFSFHTVLISGTEWENFFALRCPSYHWNNKIYRSKKDCIKDNPEYDFQLTELGWLNLNKGQAEIHMMALAEAIWDAYNEDNIKHNDNWHIPFINNIPVGDISKLQKSMGMDNEGQWQEPNWWDLAIQISTAMCARTSYTVFGEEGKPQNYEADIKLHDNLAKQGHWSPFEHIGRKMTLEEYRKHSKVISMSSQEYSNYMKNVDKDTYGLYEHDFVNNRVYVREYGWSGNIRGFIQYRKLFDNENIR